VQGSSTAYDTPLRRAVAGALVVAVGLVVQAASRTEQEWARA